jgi:CBS domain containing-hemolysin-like protein
MIEWIIVALLLAVGLGLSAFFSGSETGMYRVNRLRLHLGVLRGDPAAKRLAQVLQDERGALGVALIGNNLANYLLTSAVAYAFAELLLVTKTRAEVYTVALVTPVVFVLGEMVPKNLFRLHSDLLLARVSAPLAFFDRLFRVTGAIAALTRGTSAVNRLVGLPADAQSAFGAKRRVALLLQEALSTQPLAQDQSDLIDRVCQLSETPLHRVMVPRNRVRTISAEADRSGLLRVARAVGHARLPVHGADRRQVVGVVQVERLLESAGWTRVGDLAQPATILRAWDTVAGAITRLRREGQSMAVVTDAGGQMLGIVTINGLLQELVGGVVRDD